MSKIVSISPILWLISFVLYVLRVSISIGHLPEYNNPQSGNYYYHFTFLHKFLDIIGICFLLFIIGLLVNKFFFKHSLNRRFIYIWLIGNALIVLLFVIDPYGLINWYLD